MGTGVAQQSLLPSNALLVTVLTHALTPTLHHLSLSIAFAGSPILSPLSSSPFAARGLYPQGG